MKVLRERKTSALYALLALSGCAASVDAGTSAGEAELVGGPVIVITSPAHGAWGTPVLVEGEIMGVAPGAVEVEVNNIPAAVDPLTGEFSIAWSSLGFGPDQVFHRVFATIRNPTNGRLLASDRAVVYNPVEYGAEQLDRDDNVHAAIAARVGPTGFEDVAVIASALATEAVRSAEANVSLFRAADPELVIPIPGEICIDVVRGMDEAESDRIVASIGAALLETFNPLQQAPARLCLTDVVVDITVGMPGTLDLTLTPDEGELIAGIALESIAVDAELRFNGRLEFNPLVDWVLPETWEFADIRVARCEIEATALDVSGEVGLSIEESASNEYRVDAQQTRNFRTRIEEVDANFDGVCSLVPFINPVLSIVEAPLAGQVENLAENVLNNPMRRGCLGTTCDTPISSTLDGILAEHELPNELPLAEGITLLIDAPYDGVWIEDRGLSAITAAEVLPNFTDPDATQQLFSFSVPPGNGNNFGDETPDGSTYDIAGGVAFAAMNQSLRSTMEMGLFDFEEIDPVIDFGALAICLPNPNGGCVSGPVTLRRVLRAMGVPAALLPASTSSLMLRGRASMAPVVAVPLEDDPADAHIAHAHIAHYLLEIIEVTSNGNENLFFQFAADLKAGASLTTGREVGEIDFMVSTDSTHAVRVEPTFFPAPISFIAAGGSALASYALNQVVKPMIEASIETLHVPGIDDPSIAPSTAFELSAIATEARDQRLVVYANITPN